MLMYSFYFIFSFLFLTNSIGVKKSDNFELLTNVPDSSNIFSLNQNEDCNTNKFGHLEFEKLVNSSNLKNSMKVNNDVIVNGTVFTKKISTEKLIINGKGNLNGTLETKKVISDDITADKVNVNKITSPSGVLYVQGNVIIDTTQAPKNKKITLKGGSYSVSNISQWNLQEHDDFEEESLIEGWNYDKTNQCKEGGNKFLGGYCQLSNNEISKTYSLPEHSEIRVTASYHMFDNWEGEIGYMKIDNKIQWMRAGKTDPKKGINICGDKKINDPGYNLQIDISLPHTEDNVVVSFGSTLDKDSCNASFGVDDVMIYIK